MATPNFIPYPCGVVQSTLVSVIHEAVGQLLKPTFTVGVESCGKKIVMALYSYGPI